MGLKGMLLNWGLKKSIFPYRYFLFKKIKIRKIDELNLTLTGG